MVLFTSDRMERTLHQLSTVIVSALSGIGNQRRFIPYVLHDLAKLENRPPWLAQLAYNWCSIICQNHQSLEDWEMLLLVCLEIGFRRHDGQIRFYGPWLVQTEHHSKLVDVVFKSQSSEAITDILCAWIAGDTLLEWKHESLLDVCAGRLTGLHSLVPFSPRLRQAVISFVKLIGCKGLEVVGVERFTELLNHLHVTVKDMGVHGRLEWGVLLLGILNSSEGAQRLSHRDWELLVELAVSTQRWTQITLRITYNSRIVEFLTEWDKLECWMGVVWMTWPPGADVVTEEELDRSMRLLFRQRPGAAQKLEQWMGRWSQVHGKEIPESFSRLCKQAREAARRDAP